MPRKNNSARTLPKEFKKYFWDVDFKKLSFKSYPSFVLERVMRYGDVNALKWLLTIPRKMVTKVAENSRELDAKSRNFWQVVYEK